MVLLTLVSFCMLAALSLAGSHHQTSQGDIQVRDTKKTPLYYQLQSSISFSGRSEDLVPNGWYLQSFYIREHASHAEQWGLIVGYVSRSTTTRKHGLKTTTLDFKARLYSLPFNKKGYTLYMARILDNDDKFEEIFGDWTAVIPIC
ncbi:hypothetical protein LY78DRAFT_675201 [Colletotrichum sublineola]|nr:hypothetical protein LY78DRAFT_675201 [Colletotrichum sublineola]